MEKSQIWKGGEERKDEMVISNEKRRDEFT
jgi:hypothetical protein